MQGGVLFSVFKNVACVAASVPYIGNQVVGMINSVSVGTDDGDLPGNRFLTGRVAAAIKALG